MTLNEFKAWFEGFTESIEKQPTAKQWARITEQVGNINDVPCYTKYITHYVDRPWYPHWSQKWLSEGNISGSAGAIPTNSPFTSSKTEEMLAATIVEMGRDDFLALGN